MSKKPTSIRIDKDLQTRMATWLSRNTQITFTQLVNHAIDAFISEPRKIEIELQPVKLEEGMALLPDLIDRHKDTLDRLKDR